MTSITQFADQVHAEARELRPLRVALTIVAAVPFVIGAVCGLAVRVSWFALAWAWSAAVVGYRSGRKTGD